MSRNDRIKRDAQIATLRAGKPLPYRKIGEFVGLSHSQVRRRWLAMRHAYAA